MSEHRTTIVVQRYLDELAAATGDASAEPIVRELLGQCANRLHQLSATMLYRSYPRLARPPLNLHPDEMLSAVVERLIKAMRTVRPQGVRQFFALANQHMRWELNDLARRLDQQQQAARVEEVRESRAAAPPESSASQLTPGTQRILAAIEALPDDEREAFDLIRIQGMTQPEAAALLGVSAKTVQRRLNRGLVLLTGKLADLQPAPPPPAG